MCMYRYPTTELKQNLAKAVINAFPNIRAPDGKTGYVGIFNSFCKTKAAAMVEFFLALNISMQCT